MSFWRSTQPIAAKPHTCEACRSVIAIGEQHWSHTGMSDGEFYTYRLCNPCDAFVSFLHNGDFGFDEGVPINDLGVEAGEVLREDEPHLTAFIARQQVARAIKMGEAA